MGDLEEIKKNFINGLLEDYRYSISKFDEQALLIGSGALGLALTFIKDIVPLKDAIFLILFYISLFLLVTTILLGFLAHYLSARAIKTRIQNVEEGNYNLKPDKIIPRINLMIGITLILGIFLLVLYCVINISNIQHSSISQKTGKHNNISIDKTFHGGSLKIEGNTTKIYFVDSSMLNNKTIINTEEKKDE